MRIGLYPFERIPGQFETVNQVIDGAKGDVSIVTQPGAPQCEDEKQDDDCSDGQVGENIRGDSLLFTGGFR